MPLVAPNAWRPRGIADLEPNAWHVLRRHGNTCVVAGPGAGKTEFLAQAPPTFWRLARVRHRTAFWQSPSRQTPPRTSQPVCASVATARKPIGLCR